jgi:hypothetical protein
MLRWIAILCSACAAALAQTPVKELDVAASAAADSMWVDTAIDLRAGDSISISASGTLTVGKDKQSKTVGPDGAKRGFRDLIKSYPVNEAGEGALIGRIGQSDTAQPFLVGAQKDWKAPRAGRLYLAVNLNSKDASDGSFHVAISFASRGAESPETIPDSRLPQLSAAVIDRIPRRVQDPTGNAGDNTNFVVIGSEKDVIATFMAAGWVKVDRDKNDAVVHGLLSVLTKKAYVELPMSELYLYGRPQDYGLAHAEPIQVVSTRHHLRLWKAPFEAEGRELWVGAATHDTGFDRDQRNNGVTHKIDPDIDLEREYVAHSLDDTGLVARLGYLIPREAVKEAKTATGEAYHSDGRVLVVTLASTAR